MAVLGIVGVLATTSASAATPKWYECAKGTKNAEKKYTGKYTDKVCSKEATEAEITAGTTNKYELTPGVGKDKATKTKGGPAVLSVKFWAGDDEVECGSSKSEGKPEAPNFLKKISITYKKCISLGAPCKSEGAKAGEIKLSGLEGELGYIKGTKSSIGIKLMSETEPGTETTNGGPIAKFKCVYDKKGEPPIENYIVATVEREAIAEVTGDVGSVSKESSFVFTALEQYGEHEFGEPPKHYFPLTNILGWENELPEIEACSGKECVAEHPAHIIAGVYCGVVVEGLLSAECTPATYTGLTQTDTNKGEALEIK
ncbi:MAG TPA: hypothetical protein VMB91_09780 [Solirubrobacteraceae bacterium]|nr:hypothetical protein [Solirubrobacteraceae bacterium]